MGKIMKSFLFSLSVVLSTSIFSMHHESSESSLMPVAKPGQVIVTYRGFCPEKNIDKAINIVKQTIAYERKNSPVSYSSSPGVWSDGTIGAVDLHDSVEAMNKAFAWQSADKKWSSLYDQVAAACGITVEDFEVLNLIAR
jgi:hypothetical protein|tara:strand:+ start:1381 stop:1800 length:420 start_codon:yes stop_codon:yes gene_type:complete